MLLGFQVRIRYPSFGLQTDKSLEAILREIAGIGYDNLELFAARGYAVFPPYMNEERTRRLRALVEELGLHISAIGGYGGSAHYGTDSGYLEKDEDERRMSIKFMKKCIDLACDLDVRIVNDLSGRKPEKMDDERAWQLLSSAVGEICDYAHQRNVVIGLENCWDFMICSPDSFLRLSNEVKSDAMKMNFDSCNFWIAGYKNIPQYIRTLSQHIVYFHVKGLARGDTLHGYDFVRPGSKEDILDHRNFVSVLKKQEYSGSIVIEDIPERYKPSMKLDMMESARLAYEDISRIVESLV